MFTANNLGPSNFGTMSHFIPAGNPAPPNPLKFEFFRIYWSAFGIEEDLIKVKRIFENKISVNKNQIEDQNFDLKSLIT